MLQPIRHLLSRSERFRLERRSPTGNLTRGIQAPWQGAHNNAAERVLRGPVVGRKNFYGNRSKRGAETTAILYSLIETAKLCGVHPSEYLRDTAIAAIRRPGAVVLPF